MVEDKYTYLLRDIKKLLERILQELKDSDKND